MKNEMSARRRRDQKQRDNRSFRANSEIQMTTKIIYDMQVCDNIKEKEA